jgi:hypothetical protein
MIDHAWPIKRPSSSRQTRRRAGLRGPHQGARCRWADTRSSHMAEVLKLLEAPRGTESSHTPRWRKTDSNLWFRISGKRFFYTAS